MKSPDLRSRFIKPNMDPQKLQHFLSVYDLGSFSGAATENHVSQQAISKSVAKLEESLGVQLFERGAYGATPTLFGDTLASRAKVIIAESRLAAAELSALRGADKGYVRIGMGWSFLPRIAPFIIKRFKDRQPGVTLSIITGDSKSLFAELLRGQLEFVASAPPSEMELDAALDTKPMFEDRDVVVMRHDHPLATKAKVTMTDLVEQTWLVSLSLKEQWQRICRIFLAAGLEPPRRYVDLDSVLLAKSTILQSDCIALLSKETVMTEGERDRFHILENTDFPIPRTAYLTTRRGSRLQPAAQTLVSEIVLSCQTFLDKDQLHGIAAPHN